MAGRARDKQGPGRISRRSSRARIFLWCITFLGALTWNNVTIRKPKRNSQKEIAIEPDFAYSYEDLGILYAQLNQPDKAERYFARQFKKQSAGQLLVRARQALPRAGRYQEALEDAGSRRGAGSAERQRALHPRPGVGASGPIGEGPAGIRNSARLLKSFNDRLQVRPVGRPVRGRARCRTAVGKVNIGEMFQGRGKWASRGHRVRGENQLNGEILDERHPAPTMKQALSASI